MAREKTAGKPERREFPGEVTAQVSSFGERLRRQREMRGVSLDDIAAATKIGTRLLRALEEEHFELLPGGIFNKGFVRAYAKYLGLNEEEAVSDYLQAAGENTPDPRVIAEQNSSRIDRGGDSNDSRAAGFPIIPVLILLLVIAAGAGGWQIYQERQRDREAKRDAARTSAITTPATGISQPANAVMPPAAQTASSAENPPASTAPQSKPAATNTGDLNLPAPKTALSSTESSKPGATVAATGQTPAAGSAGAQTFEVTVRAKDSAWVSIKSDGKFAVRGIIRPPDVKAIRASDQVVVWTGNAGAVEVLFNGQPVPLSGGPNQEAVLVFNSHGVVPAKPGQ